MKEIEQYFALGKKIRKDIIRVSEAMAINGISVIPENLIGLNFEVQLVPAGTECDDIKYLSDTYNDDAHNTFDAITVDCDGDQCSWTIPTKLLGLSDKALMKTVDELKEANRKAEARRRRLLGKIAEKAEYKQYLMLKEKFESKRKSK